MPNRLARESSPYLLQHAGNPVDWYPWGDEAFQRARTEDKPILLSIGYSACHWCHVMAHESFENGDIARLMNENFINIKVDREERPEIDSIYMEAVQAMTGSGGWPLTVFLTPDGKPFFGGTYFPPDDREDMPGFRRVLTTVAEAYRQHRNAVERTGKQLLTAMSRSLSPAEVAEPMVTGTLQEAYRILRHNFDKENGGFGRAPKFPQPLAHEFLLRYSQRTHDADALKIVTLTLEKMARGGIYDQVGGGFHRYSTDSRWLVPHFEKMLYDNAQLSQVYLHAYLVTGNQLFRTIAEETLDYVLREMTDPQGGFYSTQDADSEGVEGKYYLWTSPEIAEALGNKDSRLATDYFGVTAEGNFNGGNILHVAGDTLKPDTVKRIKASLLQSREQRVKPGRDEKILASWNGLMLAGMAEAACICDRPDYLAAAVASGSFLIKSMMADGSLRHVYKDGTARLDGYLEDYALVIEGLLALHQATLSGEWLRQAIRLAEIMVEQFWDTTTETFYETGPGRADLIVRPRNIFDGTVPSSTAAAVFVLLKLARLTGNEHWEQVSVRALRPMQPLMRQQPLGFSYWLSALDFYLADTSEIAITGFATEQATKDLLHTLCATYVPNKVVAGYDRSDPSAVADLKLLEGRTTVSQPTVYICRHYICQEPVTDPAVLRARLEQS
jgi:hypothetical protein